MSYSFGLCGVTRSPGEHPGPRTSKSTTDGPKPSSQKPMQANLLTIPVRETIAINKQSTSCASMKTATMMTRSNIWNLTVSHTRTGDASASLTQLSQPSHQATPLPHYIVPWRRLPTSLREPQYYPSWMHATAICLSRSIKSPV